MVDPRTIIVPKAVRGNPARFLFTTESFAVGVGQAMTITIVRAGRTDQICSVVWSAIDVTTTPSSGTIVFQVGEVIKNIQVTAGQTNGNGAYKLSNPVRLAGDNVDPTLGTYPVAPISITGGDPGGGGDVLYPNVYHEPPTLVNPVTITSKEQLENDSLGTDPGGNPIKRWVNGISRSPNAFHYQLWGSPTQDLLLDLSGDVLSSFLEHPVSFWNWRSVICRGVRWIPPIILPQWSGNDFPSYEYPHPKFPWTMVIRVAVKNHCFIEGCHIKLDNNFIALNSDYVVWRGTYMNGAAPYTDFNNSSIVLQNCLFEGVEGANSIVQGSSDPDDDTMAHADFIHTQAENDSVGRPKLIATDNCVMRNGQEGYVIHGWSQGTGGNANLTTFDARNVDYSINNDNAGLRGGQGIMVALNSMTITANPPDNSGNVYLENIKWTRVFDSRTFLHFSGGTDAWYVDPAYAGSSSQWYGHPEIEQYPYASNNPPMIEFVAADGTGLGPGYVSPHV